MEPCKTHHSSLNQCQQPWQVGTSIGAIPLCSNADICAACQAEPIEWKTPCGATAPTAVKQLAQMNGPGRYFWLSHDRACCQPTDDPGTNASITLRQPYHLLPFAAQLNSKPTKPADPLEIPPPTPPPLLPCVTHPRPSWCSAHSH